ncbi:MAG: sensor histidine kinase [Bacteroidetes bacterium]|nr:sensor histidine kinase [Bacteroidota bacterium]MBS1539979.1 sensor histidine kinase [Bacteroidota bacterium]
MKWLPVFLFIFFWPKPSTADIDKYIRLINSLEFNEAKQEANTERDSLLRFEMIQLADILFYEGQIDINKFREFSENTSDKTELLILRTLSQGYLSLFYDRVKGNAYKKFYNAYQLAKKSENTPLIKMCLLATLKYYRYEVLQHSNYYLPYLQHFESLEADTIDRFWITIYRMIFFTQTLQQPEEEYFKLSSALEEFEHRLNPESPLLAYVFYEKALQLDIGEKVSVAVTYYHKAIRQTKDYPFLRNHRFNGALRLMLIEIKQKKFDSARIYLSQAHREADKADTLLSNHTLNLHAAFLMKAEQKYDSAFQFLWRAYLQDFQLDFRTNTLEINRLNVVLETREKENANLQLKQDRAWLITALATLSLTMVAGYFAYANQRSKTKIRLQEKEVQAMKLEKQLKAQEIHGIDLMIEGQEKERQRMANELHDHLGSMMATLKLYFQNFKTKRAIPEAEQNSLFQKTDELIDEAYQKVRTMAHAHHAGINAQDGLLPAIRNFAAKVSYVNKLSIEVEEHGMDTRLENSLEITTFRIIQELITNVIKYANATEVFIHLTRHEDSINVMVEDNGIGFDITKIKPGETMGLYSIQKRVENLGGQVTIESIAQNGTTVIFDIPLQYD